MNDETHYQMRLEAALFGTASAATPREIEAIARQAEELRSAHDAMSAAIDSAGREALPTLR